MRNLFLLCLLNIFCANVHAANDWKIFCDSSKVNCGVGQYVVGAEDPNVWVKVSFHEKENGSIQMYWLMPPLVNSDVLIFADGKIICHAVAYNCTSEHCEAKLDFADELKNKLLAAKVMEIGMFIDLNDPVALPFDTVNLGEMLVQAWPMTANQ